MSATGIHSTSARADQAGVSGLGAAGVFAKAKDDSSLEAYVGPAFGVAHSHPQPASVTTTNGVDIEASLTAPVLATVHMLNVGILANVGVTIAAAIARPIVRAFLGDHANVAGGSGAVKLGGAAIVSSIATGTGVGAGLGFSASGALVTALLTPTVGAFAVGHNTISGNGLTMSTRLNVDRFGVEVRPTYHPLFGSPTTVTPAYVTVFLGDAALGAGVAAGDVEAGDSATGPTGGGPGPRGSPRGFRPVT